MCKQFCGQPCVLVCSASVLVCLVCGVVCVRGCGSVCSGRSPSIDWHSCRLLGLLSSSHLIFRGLFLSPKVESQSESEQNQKYSPTARSVICSTWACGGVARAYITACATSSACRMTSPSLALVSSGTISVATQPGLMLWNEEDAY